MIQRFPQIKLDRIDPVVQQLLELLPIYPCIALDGEMGSGKTTLAMALLKGLGIQHTEGSPTFNIVQPYPLDENKVLYHIDAYRINNEKEALELGFEELFEENAYFIVEWPEKITNFLPERRISLLLESTVESRRNYTLVYGN